MCGILVYTAGQKVDGLREQVQRRGPDYYGTLRNNFIFESSVLSLRKPFTKQPLELGSQVLCFNGEIYEVDGNDASYFFDNLQRNGPRSTVEGEYAYVYFDGCVLWFARDQIGRRSLLYSFDEKTKSIIISSVGEAGFSECQAGTLYKYVDGILSVAHSAQIQQVVSTGYGLERMGEILRSAVERRMVLPDQGAVGVLFSGGLDCTIVARLMDMILPAHFKIELLNVAFENKRTNASFDTPDRTLARQSFEELSRFSALRFELVEINVPYEKAVSHYKLVRELMYPSTTVMDLSIALAFFCAAEPQQGSQARVLLSGLGADELFGGYSRHMRAAAEPQRLAAELELDFNRIGSRNLGRDDRVCCYWGREVRYPFLDKQVVDYALGLDPSCKASPADTKIALRRLAVELGLTKVAQEKKRAIQFGAKSAKMDPGSGRAKGTDSL